ncbi:hypothetical protein SAMN04487910_1403 [Aquimarina amphilecti]|uniref:Uncharacterized protein n=1 Tax=Aquimarina amphilecti TaxID=1038014 RepID=A0A1H7KRC2_AQUAM|nr:hypothetical protein [Aquimarina amphilecti]SEK89114.1 hypothetical protein SAMN04487910_1403 [Aquimarina amphilecti]
MKKYKPKNSTKGSQLSDKKKFQNIDDPELQLVISDVMVYSEDYNTYIDDIGDWL